MIKGKSAISAVLSENEGEFHIRLLGAGAGSPGYGNRNGKMNCMWDGLA